MRCLNCKFLYSPPLTEKDRQEYYLCEKGVWSGPEIAWGKDYGVGCKEFEFYDEEVDDDKND